MKQIVLAVLLMAFAVAGDIDTAKRLFENKQYRQAVELFQKNQNSPIAQYYLGKAYMFGLGVDRNLSKTLHYAEQSAAAHYPAGINLLGVIYDDGYGVAKNKKRAVKYYRQAAQLGNTNAMINLATIYANSKNVNQTISWLKKAYHAGSIRAIKLLGNTYASTEVKKYKQAIHYYKEYINHPAAKGLGYVFFRIGDAYQYTNDYENAYKYYAKSAQTGDKDALFSIIYFPHKEIIDKNEYVDWIKQGMKANIEGVYNQYYLYLLNNNAPLQEIIDFLKDAYYKDHQLRMGCQLAFKYAANMNFDFDYYPKAYSLAKELIDKYPGNRDFYSCYDALFYLYQQGSYVSQDYLKAINILKHSYKISKDIYKGVLAEHVAEFYLTKFQDDKNATLWYKKAYEHTGDKTLLTRVEAYKKSLPPNQHKDLNTTRKLLSINAHKDPNTTRQKIYPIIDTFARQEQVLAFLESQKYYFIATDQKSIKIYDKKSLTLQKELSGWIGNGVAGMITQMAYDEKGKLLYCTPIFSATDISKNDTIVVYDITTGKIVKTIKKPNVIAKYFNISSDGKYLVVIINYGSTFNIINTDTHETQYYNFSNITSFTQANIERNGDDYFVHVLGTDNFLYTFSVKQRKNIAKVPFTHQTAFKPFNTAHALGIFNTKTSPVKHLKLKQNNLFIQDTQGTQKKFDLSRLILSETNATIDFSDKSTSNIHIEYQDKNTSVEIYRDNKRIGDIAFYATPVLSHKIVRNKYIVITLTDMSAMFVFNLSGRPIAKLMGFNALQTHITYQDGYLITYGKDDVIHLWDMKQLDTYNKLPEQYNKEMPSFIEMLSLSDDVIRKIMQLNHLPYKLTPRQFRSYLKMILLKKVPIYPLASLYIKEGKDWILYTHQGLFAYGGKGKDLLKYHQNRGRYEEARIVENDRLFKKFYRPDLIRDLLAGRPVTLPVDVQSVLLNIKPPALRLLGHTMLNDHDVELTYQVCDAGNGVADPRLLINGQAINPPNARGFRIEKIKHAHKKCTTFRSVLTLDPGTNTIVFKAYDHGKNIANSSPILKIVANYIIKSRTKTPISPIVISEKPPVSRDSSGSRKRKRPFHGLSAPLSPSRETSFVNYSEGSIAKTDASQPKGDLYFLAIAIDTYQKSAYNLRYSIQDAKAVEERYLAGNKHAFNHIHTYHLYDQNVTKENVANTFDAISKMIQYGDTFLLYLAGHGTYKNGKYLFVPYEVHKKLSIDFLKENFAKIYTDKYLVLLDTCRSGAAMDKLYDEATTNRLAHDSAKVNYIVSSSADQVALEGYKNHGVFTYSVIHAFQSHPALTVFQLADILTDEVPKISQEAFHFRQVPQVRLNRDFLLIHPVHIVF